VQPYVTCQTASPRTPLRDLSGGGYTFRRGNVLVTCSFDRDKCMDKQLSKNTDNYVRNKLGLPSAITNLAASLGGSETRAPSMGGASPQNFCACSHAKRPIDPNMIRISDAAMKLASFGMASPSEELRRERDYQSCGYWHFPSRKGKYAGTPQNEYAFRGAWEYGQSTKCGGGS
jgi:hypothetical protein